MQRATLLTQSGHRIRKSRVNGLNCKTERLAPAHRVGECAIQIGESCFAIFAEVMLPYTFTYGNYSFENVQ
jgi:hypothetical protein